MLKRYFSLVELAVVIAILALLVSMLSPSLTRMMDGSNRLVCKTNLKQAVHAELIYAEDYQGLVPDWGVGRHPLNYEVIGGVYKDWMGNNSPGVDVNESKLLDPYLDPFSDAWFCPNDPEGDTKIWSGKAMTSSKAYYSTIGTSYLRNPWFLHHKKYRITDLQRPSISIDWTEHPTFDVCGNRSRPNWWTDLPRWSFHDNLKPFDANFATNYFGFYDGHVDERGINPGQWHNYSDMTWDGT
jgi:type II secretory pathway pseudopilin PulG